MVINPYQYAFNKVMDYLLQQVRHESLRSPVVLKFLEENGFTKLEHKFESIYVFALIALIDENKPKPVLEILNDEKVRNAFKESWRTGNENLVSSEFAQAVEALESGDRAKKSNIDLESELKHFQDVFKITVNQARTPGEQEDSRSLKQILVGLEKIKNEGMPFYSAPHHLLDAQLIKSYEQRYLDQMRDQCGTLYTEGVDAIPAPLFNVFVILQSIETSVREIHTNIPSDSGERVTVDKTSQHPQEQESSPVKSQSPSHPVPLSTALQEHTHLVIIGDPGSGKTTTLQFIALGFAGDDLTRDQIGLHEDRLPIRVDLHTWSDNQSLGDLMVESVACVGLFDPVSTAESQRIAYLLLKQWLAKNRVIALLDGLDEVPETRRTKVVEVISNFAKTNEGKGSRIVVTSRTMGYRTTRVLGEPFMHYTIQPFGGVDDALPYTIGWLKAIAGLEEEAANSRARTLLNEMRQRAGLHQVIGNPLLLRLAISFYVERGEVAQSRADLYHRYVSQVWMSREQRRRSEGVSWSRKQIGNALEEIAWRLHIQERKTDQELALAVESNDPKIEDGNDLLEFLCERVGLLATYQYERKGYTDFRHRTFREYFVAQRLSKHWQKNPKKVWRFLRPRLHHSEWREPVLLLSALVGDTKAPTLIRHILAAKSMYERELKRDLLLAGECLCSGSQIKGKLYSQILNDLLRLYVREIIQQGSSYQNSPTLLARSIQKVFSSIGEEGYLCTVPSLVAMMQSMIRRESIKAVGDLDFRDPQITQYMLDALNDPATIDVAAESLGKVGTGTSDVVNALMQAQLEYRQTNGWREPVEIILEALGLLGQKYPEVVDRLLEFATHPEPNDDMPDFHYPVAWALCKAAETSMRAMEFVIQGLRSRDGWGWGNDDSARDTIDDNLWEGLKEGIKLFKSASPEVVDYLLKRGYEDEKVVTWARSLLSKIIKGSPLIQCKTVNPDGSVQFKTLDLSEPFFDICLRNPMDNLFLYSPREWLVRWGISRPDLIVRLLNIVRNADPFIFADICGARLDPSKIERLTSSDETVRQNELDQYVAAVKSYQSNELSWLKISLDMIADVKSKILFEAYHYAYPTFWREFGWPEQEIERADPHVIAALACFRAWDDKIWRIHIKPEGFWWWRSEGKQQEVNSGIEKAISLIKAQDDTIAIEILSDVVAGKKPSMTHERAKAIFDPLIVSVKGSMTGHEIEEIVFRQTGRKHGEGAWYANFMEPIGAANALAKLSTDYPEAQKILLSSLNPGEWTGHRSGFSSQSETQEGIVRALGYVRQASPELIATLIEIVSKNDDDLYGAGHAAIESLKQLGSEGVSLLIQGYDKSNAWTRSSILKALSTVEPLTSEITELFQHALKDEKDWNISSTAATGLANVKEPGSAVIDALLAACQATPEAIVTLGVLADRIAMDDRERAQRKLRKIAKSLRYAVHHPPATITSSAYSIACDALGKVASKLTEIEVGKASKILR